MLPEQHSHYNRVLSFAEHNLYLGMHIDRTHALELEEQTRSHSASKLWHEICRRAGSLLPCLKIYVLGEWIMEKLALRLLKSKNILTAAMKCGLENIPFAAKLYSEITGNMYT